MPSVRQAVPTSEKDASPKAEAEVSADSAVAPTEPAAPESTTPESSAPESAAQRAAKSIKGLVRVPKIRTLQAKQSEPEEPEEQAYAEPTRPVLVEFRGITKRYGRHNALDSITLKLYKGEFLSLVGPSGAGKSTLIKCLTLQERPDEGRIIVAGRDITLLKRRELPYYRRKVGVVFQDYRLLATKTVYENIAFALEVAGLPTRDIKERVDVILDTVGMLPKSGNFPNELSGGEQQRVAIARALVHDPKILIADEPTGNLDPVNTWEIIELLYKINQSGTMVILATHDREIVDALKRRVITLRDGQLVADQERGTYLV